MTICSAWVCFFIRFVEMCLCISFYSDGTHSHPLLRHSSVVDYCDVFILTAPIHIHCWDIRVLWIIVMFLFWRHPFTSIAETFECCGLLWCFYSDGTHSHPLLRHSSVVDYCIFFYSDGTHSHLLLRHSSAVDYCDVFILTAPIHIHCWDIRVLWIIVMFSFWRHPFTSITETFECCGLLWCFQSDGTHSHPLLRYSSAVDYCDVFSLTAPIHIHCWDIRVQWIIVMFLFWRHPFTSIAETFECCGLLWCFYSDGTHSHPLLRHSSAVDYCDVFILTAPIHIHCWDIRVLWIIVMSHSDGTHSLQSIQCWDTDAETHFCSHEKTNSWNEFTSTKSYKLLNCINKQASLPVSKSCLKLFTIRSCMMLWFLYYSANVIWTFIML